jgi:two-component system sensor histidine kinase MtrB
VIRVMADGHHNRHILFLTLPADISLTMIVVDSTVVALIVLTIAATAALLIARRVLHPVGQLAQAADRIASGDLDVRLTPEGHDELARLVATFNTMTAQVQQSVEELRHMEANARRFAADASHELRSPLAAMTAVTEILTDRAAALDAEEARVTALVVEGITRLGRLVEDLLEISRFDAGTIRLDLETLRLADAVDACLALRDWDGRVRVDVPDYLIVTADRRRLDFVLTHGAPPVEIRAAAILDDPARRLRVTVRDHGPGLPPDALTAVFDRFYKAEAARSPSDGSGLGLAIALENARLHGGSITASNGPQSGATFTLPRRTIGSLNDAASTESSAPLANAQS